MSQKPTNINTELARERNRAAAERTLMAWIRTCLSLISFGFGIDRIFYAIEQTSVGENIDPFHLSRIVGLAFISIGTGAMMLAAIDHRRELKRILDDNYLYAPRTSLSLVVSVCLVLVGAFAFLGILIKANS
ncbi:MAG: DUF202 domain-containing protein [Xenococcaceae cyanobacterium MO_188.B32]|nr:DUF202 domain-containing protein [Xenococcaceae cyanobacterium MO_188.B32]